MIRRLISVLLKWVIILGLMFVLFYVAYRVNGEMRAERAREGGGDQIQSPRRLKDGVVNLGVEDADRSGIETEAARAVSWSERVTVYGQAVPNPAATVEVRSPFAGMLRAASDSDRPMPGQWVRSGQILGWVDIRMGPQERLNLRDNLNNARLRKEGAEKIVRLQQERVNRVEKMSRSQIVPGQQLDDAEVLLADAETQLAIASAAHELWRNALEEADRPGGRETSAYSQALTAPADGEITELAARPGMAIEAGGLVVQLVDFRRSLVRLDIPPGFSATTPPRVRLLAVSADPSALGGILLDPSKSAEAASTVEATLIGAAPRVDQASQFVGYWYAAESTPGRGTAGNAGSRQDGGVGIASAWRPGLLVKANLNSPADRKREAVAVPAGAVLFHQGRPLVYVRVKPGAFERREVRLLGREGDSWVLDLRQDSDLTGLKPGEIIVRSGAQILLSEEFRGDVDAD